MKTGSGLLLIGAGALLAFAVTTNTDVFNLHTAGYVLMLIGILGVTIPRRSFGWVGRRMFVRRYETRPGGPVENVTYSPYITRNPGNTRVRAGLPAGTGTGNPTPEGTTGETDVTEDIYEE
jgi:hypothetical protein